MDKPILLIKNNFLAPLKEAEKRLSKINEVDFNNLSEIINEGLFVLAISTFENSLNDTLKILFAHFPNKLGFQEKKIKKNDLIEGTNLAPIIDRYVSDLSYESIETVLDKFCEYTGIDKRVLSENDKELIKEIKATRNILIHNNLIVNDDYLNKAGEKKRSKELGDELKIDDKYLSDTIVTLNKTIETLLINLESKYSDYTKIRALKSLFNYIFETPIMDFENEFDLDIKKDRIKYYKAEASRKHNLSGSETIFFNLWMAHFLGRGISTENLNFFHFDENNRKKLRYFISKIDLLKNSF